MLKLYERIGALLKKIGLAYQSKILLIVVLIGLMLISEISIVALNGIKYSYDTLSTNFTCVNRLKNVANTFDDNIKNLEYYLLQKEKNIPLINKPDIVVPNFMITNCSTRQNSLPELLQHIYLTLILRDIKSKLLSIENDISSYLFALKELSLNLSNDMRNAYNLENITQFEIGLFESKFKIIQIYIKTIEAQNEKLVQLKKILVDSLYKITMIILGILIFIIIATTLFLSKLILDAISSINRQMQETIDIKTMQLREFAESLEAKVAKEIKKSRQKDELLHSQNRLASMGEMMQNIAHQWRQPLNALIMLIQSFKSKLENDKLTNEFVLKQSNYGLKIAKNMSDTIENFRNFFHSPQIKEKFNLNKCVKDCIFLVQPHLDANDIEIVFTPVDDYFVNGYQNCLVQVILNILLNAKDAMENNASGTRKIIKITTIKEDKNILINIVDTGGGIENTNLDRIFEPYFTTKHKAVGTGIGLYMSKQMVENTMSGTINVQNIVWYFEEKKYLGAAFIISIPFE